MAEPETQNCSRVIFFNNSYFWLTLLKFQTLLTLSSHNYGSKNYSNKNHDISRKPWTSAVQWHTLDTSWKILHMSNWPKCENIPFFPFSVKAPRNNVGGRCSDNFKGTGRAHSSFWRFLPIILREHIEIGVNFKIWRPRPLWSEIIHTCVR